MNALLTHPAACFAWRFWPAAAAGAAVLALAAAHGFERFGDMAPCALCLRQREVYWAILAVAAITAIVWLRAPDGAVARAVDAGIGAIFLTGALIAGFHAGVEWGWFPPPANCMGGGLDLGGLGSGRDPAEAFGARIVSCEDAPFRALGLSMAGWNALMSLGLAGLSFLAAARPSALYHHGLEEHHG